MRKKNKIIINIFAYLLLLTLLGCNEHPNDYITHRWGIPLPFYISKYNLEKQDTYWGYAIVQITATDMDNLLKIDMPKYSYSNWKKSNSNLIVGDINIDHKSLYSSIYKYPDKCQLKGIFLDKAQKRVIFVDYNWAGY